MKMHLNYFVYFLFSINYVICTHLILPHGGVDDKSQKEGDDENYDLKLTKSVKMIDNDVTEWKISSNGAIFSEDFLQVYETDIDQFPDISILAYWTDAQYVSCDTCGIYYRQLNEADIEIVSDLINDDGFIHDNKSSFVVTWIAPQYYRRSFINSFQVIVSSDGQRTFVTFLYENLTYGFRRRQHNAIAGIKVGRTYCDLSQNQPEYLYCRSNVGKPGIYLFEITQNFQCTQSSDVFHCSDCFNDYISGYQTCTDGIIFPITTTTTTTQTTTTTTTDTITTPTESSTTAATTRTSIPVIDCAQNASLCEDLCDTSTTPHICACSNGILQEDYLSCGYDDFMVYSQFGSIWLDHNKLTDQVTVPNSLTFDKEKKYLFYVDVINQKTVIGMIDFAGKNIKELYKSDTIRTSAMAFFSSTKSLYFASVQGVLYKIDGIYDEDVNVETVHDLRHFPRNFTALVADNCERKLYAAVQKDNLHYSEIYLYDMSEQIQQHIILAYIQGVISSLTYDANTKKLYWTVNGIIESMNNDGSCRQVLTSTLNSKPNQLGSDGDFLYWTDLMSYKNGSNKMYSIWITNKDNGQSYIYRNHTIPFVSLTFINDDCTIVEEGGKCQSQFVDQSKYSHSPLYESDVSKKKFLRFDDDKKSQRIHLINSLKIFGKRRSSLYVNQNGFVTFESSDEEVSPDQESFAVFHTNLTTYAPGEIYYTETKHPVVLERAEGELNIEGFNSTHAVIVTWIDVIAMSMLNQRNSFQIIFVTDGVQTHVLMKYYRIETEHKFIGFNDTCVNYESYVSSAEDLLINGWKISNVDSSTCEDDFTTTTPSTATPPQQNDFELYPYGDEHGDSMVANGDDQEYGIIYLNKDVDQIKLFSNFEEELHININGNISVKEPVYSTEQTVIGIFSKDLTTTQQTDGDIYYRITSTDEDFQNINNNVNSYFHYQNNTNKTFETKQAIIVTYLNVREYSTNNRNTFQAVIASDGKETCIILAYKYLQSTGAKVFIKERFCSNLIISEYTGYDFYKTSNFNVQGKHVYCLSKPSCEWEEVNDFPVYKAKLKPTKNFELLEHSWFYPNKRMDYPFFIHEPIRPRNNFSVSQIFSSTTYQGVTKFQVYKFSINEDDDDWENQYLGIPTLLSSHPDISFDRIALNVFSEEIKCYEKSFDKEFDAPPIMKLSFSAMNGTEYNNYVLVWLLDVTEKKFEFCVKELMLFSGNKTIALKYIAVSRSSNHFVTNTLKFFNNSLCHTYDFPKTYSPPPLVFTTALSHDINSEGVFAWVKNITTENATICAKSSMDTLTKKNENITVHLIIKKQVNKCDQYDCGKYLQCYLHDVSYEPYCYCPNVESCNKYQYDPVCGYDLISYSNECIFHATMCQKYGIDNYNDHQYRHHGKCRDVIFDYGNVTLEVTDSLARIYCQHVTLNSHMFSSIVQIDVQLSVSWHNKTTSSPIPSWIQDLDVNGFKACVSKGEIPINNGEIPSLYWMAYETSNQSDHLLESGVKNISGCDCVPVDIKNANPDTSYFVTVEKKDSSQQNYNAWFKLSTHEDNTQYHICVTSVDTESTCDENIQLHWLALHQEQQFVFTEKQNILFSEVPTNQMMCKKVELSTPFGKLPSPTVLISPYYHSESESVPLNHVIHTWVKYIEEGEIEVCLRHTMTSFKDIAVSFVIIPTLCPVGWEYNNYGCYYVGQNASFNQSKQHCNNMNSHLVSIESTLESHYLNTLVYPISTWVGLQYTSDDTWEWANNEPMTIMNWKVNGHTGGNCTLIDIDTLQWIAMNCSLPYNFICEKDSILQPETFDPCDNYVLVDEDFRVYENKTSATQQRCDAEMFYRNPTWFSFGSEYKLLENTCTDSWNRCGTKYPGWLATYGDIIAHPSEEDGIVERDLHFFEYYCASDHGVVHIKKCPDRYVYRFDKFPFWSCDYGVCLERMT